MKTKNIRILYTKFGVTVEVPATIYNSTGDNSYTEVLFIERSEDYYAIHKGGSPVAVVTGEDFRAARRKYEWDKYDKT